LPADRTFIPMPRIGRVVAQGLPHHVTQRGNARQQVFYCAEDYALYKDLLWRYASRSGVALWAYCLMPNHIHLICVPENGQSLASTLSRTHADYARHFNIVGRSCGHVWQARYFSCPVEGVHCWQAMAYVERNPVRAGLATEAADYRWSSAAAHTGVAADAMLDLRSWQAEYDAHRWAEALRTSVAEECIAERIRQATLRGRPLGGEAFVQSLEKTTGRRLHPNPPGRPRRENALASAASGPEQMRLGIE
jgi:putative transposase